MTFIPSFILPRDDGADANIIYSPSSDQNPLDTGVTLSHQAGIGLVVGTSVTFGIVLSFVIRGLYYHVLKSRAEEKKAKAELEVKKALAQAARVRRSEKKALASSSTSPPIAPLIPMSPPQPPRYESNDPPSYKNPSSYNNASSHDNRSSYDNTSSYSNSTSYSTPRNGIMKPQADYARPGNASGNASANPAEYIIPAEHMRTERR